MRINAVITGQAINPKVLADILGKLDMGDVVRAKVLEITSGELMLKLFDGTVFRAATASEIDTAPGENLELVVKGKNGGTLVLETVKKDASNMDYSRNEAIRLLNDLNIKPDKKNLQLAGEIKTAGINATKEFFEKASQLLDKFKFLTPEKAVFLSSKSIPTEPRTMETVIRLIEGNLKLGSQLEDLHSLISKLADNKNMEINTTGSQEAPKKPMPAASSIIPINNAESSDNALNKAQSNQPAAIENKADHKETAIKKNVTSDNVTVDNESNIESALFDRDSLKTHQRTKDINSSISSSKTLDNKQGNTALTKGVPEIKPTEADMFKIIEPDQDIHLYNGKISEDSSKEIRELTGKLKESFKSLFVKADSENLSSELDVKKIYKDILDKLDSIKHINQILSLPERADISARVNNIEEGIKLLNQISSNNVYVQIPLNISGFHTTGELYIIKKEKNKKRIDPRNVIMLISLDTQNLGRVETLMDVKGKNVGINLRAEEQKVIDFIRDNYRHLYSSLMDKGYRLVDVKYRLLTERTNPANVDRSIKKDLVDGRISVDLKI